MRQATIRDDRREVAAIDPGSSDALPHDEMLFEAIWQALKTNNADQIRLMLVNTTLHPERLWVSETLARGLQDRQEIEVIGEPSR